MRTQRGVLADARRVLMACENAEPPSIYDRLLAAGVSLDSHESDLYAEVNDVSRAIVQAYPFRCNVTTFWHQQTGDLWFDIPFAYQPFWSRRSRRIGARP